MLIFLNEYEEMEMQIFFRSKKVMITIFEENLFLTRTYKLLIIKNEASALTEAAIFEMAEGGGIAM